MQVLCLYGPKKSKPRMKSELRKQQYTVTRFDGNHLLAQVIQFFGRWKNLCVTVQFFLCFILNLRAVQVPSTSSRGLILIWRGDLTKGFLRYEFGGLIFGWAYTRRGLLSEFYGMYPKLNNQQSCKTNFSSSKHANLPWKMLPYRAAKLTSMT